MNYLKLIVRTFNWRGCNKAMLYTIITRVAKLLHKATLEMKQARGNIVQGVNNAVMGYGNIVMGSNNELVGLNNWFFTSGYSTPASQYDEGVLAIGNYKI